MRLTLHHIETHFYFLHSFSVLLSELYRGSLMLRQKVPFVSGLLYQHLKNNFNLEHKFYELERGPMLCL